MSPCIEPCIEPDLSDVEVPELVLPVVPDVLPLVPDMLPLPDVPVPEVLPVELELPCA
jgi:hypothetical protein